jgi:hypothetical protein
MDSNSIKLIAIDLDGTLLNSTNSLSSTTIDSLHRMTKKGIKVVLASGRPYQSIVPIADQLGLSSPIISANGALVINNKIDIIRSLYLDSPISQDIIAYGSQESYAMSVYYNGLILTNSMKQVEMHRTLEGLSAVYSSNLLIEEPIVKIIYSDEPQRITNAYNFLKMKFTKRLYMTQSDNIFLDFMNINASKGNALSFIMKLMNISKDQIMAFGNSYNDISMFKICNHSVAMENSPEIVKQEANYVTLSNDSNGVAYFLNQIF